MKKLITIFLIVFLTQPFIFSWQIHCKKVYSADLETKVDFIAIADQAIWKSSFGDQPFPGRESSRTGSALWRSNERMENNIEYAKILQTTPDVQDNGYIQGFYPETTIPEKARLVLEYGFLKGSSETKGVAFSINFQMGRTRPVELYKKYKSYTQQVDAAFIDLSSYAGKTGSFNLRVSSIKPTLRDISAWSKILLEAEKPAEALPDLIISDIRVDTGKVFFKLKNTGAGQTPELHRGQFIQAQLSVDGKVVSSYQIARTLNPGDEFEYLFPDYLLPKSKTEQVLRVCADSLEFIKESNERNNCTEKRIQGESTEEETLKFLRLPQVSGITSSSVRFTWLMNNDSDGIILYDTRFRMFGLKISDTKIAKVHDITLSNLKPGTLYEFYALCQDKNGSVAKSANNYFKTLTEPLKTKPTLQFTLASKLSGKITIQPILSDMKSFSRVRLYVDGHPVFTNFAEPYQVELDTKKYTNGSHEFKLQGIDINGTPYVEIKEGLIVNKDLKLDEGPVITILSPVNKTEYPNSTALIPLKATISHKQDYDIHHLEVFVDGNLVHIAKPKKTTGFWATKDELPKEFTYDIPISYFAEGDHNIELRAFDSENVDNFVITNVKTHTPSWYKPVLVLSYKTSLEAVNNTSYKVDFMITNNGNLSAKDITLQISQDILPGFIISNANQGAEVILYSNYQVLELHLSELDFKNGQNVFHLYFDLSPVFISPVNWSINDYVIMKEVSLIYNWDGNTKVPDWENWDMANHVSNDVFWMAKSADYLIISNLKTLLMNSSPNKSDLNRLFMSMAELAAKKKGIIGLMNEIWLSPETVKQKIQDWGEGLSPDWFNSGYLLIVGETEIVPSFTRSFNNGSSVVPTTDYPYADTSGNEMYPELTIGRIIGDCPACLTKPIQSSLDVANGTAVFRRNHHQNSNAFTLSGTGDGEADFWDSAYWVGEVLKQEFYYVGQGNGRAIINEGVTLDTRLRQRSSGLTVFFYRDHGAASCLCNVDVVATSDWNSPAYVGNLLFGNSRPFVFACCCDAGKYEGIYGIAEAFMGKAGAYIGSTGLSDRASNNYNALQFFKSWVNQPQKSLGQAFKELRIFAFYNAVWNAEYQFYGDPKFGIETP
jgi:hypothetical protein